MATFEFTCDVSVDNLKGHPVARKAGETIAREDIPEGSFRSLKRLGQIVEFVETPPDVPPPEVPAAEALPAEAEHEHHATKKHTHTHKHK